MVQDFSEIFIKTGRQGLYDFTSEVKERCSLASVRNGLVNLSILHTSASLLIQRERRSGRDRRYSKLLL